MFQLQPYTPPSWATQLGLVSRAHEALLRVSTWAPGQRSGCVLSICLKSLKTVASAFGILVDWQVPTQRCRLAQLPTPIHPWAVPGLPPGCELHIKRDDLTGMQLSGNKVGEGTGICTTVLKIVLRPCRDSAPSIP